MGCLLAVGRGEELEVVLAGSEGGLVEGGLVEEVPVPVFDCMLEVELEYKFSQTWRDFWD